MSEKQTENQGQELPSAAHEGHTGLIARFVWAIVGPCVWGSSLFFVGKNARWVGWPEALLLATTIAMGAARRAEHRTGKGTTLYGEASTDQGVKLYLFWLLVISLASWIGIKVIVHSMVS